MPPTLRLLFIPTAAAAVLSCNAMVELDGYRFDRPHDGVGLAGSGGNGSGANGTGAAGQSCDGSQVFTDPYGDDSLRLTGSDSYGLAAQTETFSWICVEQFAQLEVCETVAGIELAGSSTTAVGGNGLRSASGLPYTLYVDGSSVGTVYFLVHVEGHAATVVFDTPHANVLIDGQGTGTVNIEGVVGTLHAYAADTLGVGPVTSSGDIDLGAGKDVQMNGAINSGGALTMGGAPPPAAPSCTGVP